MRPSGHHHSGCHRPNAGLLQQDAGRGLLEKNDGRLRVLAELVVEGSDALRQADGLGACGGDADVFLAGAPLSDPSDLLAAQRPASIDPKINRTHQRSERVDVRSALDRHGVASHEQHSQTSTHAVVLARDAKAVDLKW